MISKSPPRQNAGSPKEMHGLFGMDAGRDQTQYEVRIIDADESVPGQRLVRFFGFFPTPRQNQRDGMQRYSLACAVCLTSDEQKKDHWHPTNERCCRSGAGNS